jgi:phosphatidylinositol-3-phosphatase
MSGERPFGPCQDCGAPVEPNQRYCVNCGQRMGSRDPRLVALLRRVGERSRVTAPPAHAVAEPIAHPRASAAARGLGLALPPRRVCALLVLVFLGFGVLLGHVAGSRVSDTLAASRQPMKIVLPSQALSATAGAPTSTASSSASASSGAGEPPEAQAAPTPEPAPAPAKATAPATGGGSPAVRAPSRPGGPGGGEGGSGKGSSGASRSGLPPVKHVFVIMLSDEPYASAFGPASTAPYLAQTLERKGELLVHYDAVAHEQLADELALLSGQGPTAETAADCPNYDAIAATGMGPDQQVLGNGCVYPSSTQTLPGQLAAKHLTWRAYVQGTDEPDVPGACAHPPLGQADPTSGLTPSAAGPYATYIDPFVYFQSIAGSPTCAADVVGLGRLQGDLASPARTPSFSYIAPDRCQDASPTPCSAGEPAGLEPANRFLAKVVPEIMESKAYSESGLLVITVDEAPSSGELADSSSCCGQPSFPNVASTAPSGLSPRGGGAVGALLLSPFVKGATTNQEPFNHFSLLRTIEDLFGLAHLGYAALPAVKPFEPSMFTGG